MATIMVSHTSSVSPDAMKAKSSASSIFAILDRKSRIDPSDDSKISLKNVKGDIEFQHTFALVGESGCGKSTVISLLQRFYDPNSSEIMLDGIDIKKLQLRWLKKQMGLVSQEPLLFSGTSRANIAYGKEEGKATKAEIIVAAKSANAHKFTSELQQGYDTIVREQGVQLSGGQKQWVASAHAIVKAPTFYCWMRQQVHLMANHNEWFRMHKIKSVDRTTIVVAHRLSTIMCLDLIAVFKNGVITELGRNENLIHINNGVYASLIALHSSASQCAIATFILFVKSMIGVRFKNLFDLYHVLPF
ncbi:hypothetical protein GIB67_024968 [Kingdonia uniflora]|uniref:ABC transporter domain-containing protein n=1 Tax=Kingdonia uniflora TaxID=39325 RepID=A0A7J7NYS9_9MAGN|nr:hypothetical protein GIB67_024968 [Kingdonia uniflora]